MEPLTDMERLLLKYGCHQEDCRCVVRVDEDFWATMSEDSRKPCTCGWRELSRSLEAREPWRLPVPAGDGI